MNGCQHYEENKINTSTRGKLLLMAYDGALKFVRQAKVHMAEKCYEEQNTCILKTQRIILELISTINVKANETLANHLLSIYEYLFNRLVEANITDNLAILDEVEHDLERLRQAWNEADHQHHAEQLEGGPQSGGLYVSG